MELRAGTASDLAPVVHMHLERVFHLCYRMTLDGRAAEGACYETFARAASLPLPAAVEEREAALLQIAADVLGRRVPVAPPVTFELLDETLRSEATRTGEGSSITDPERELLLWELKQGCMTAVINCLPSGERVAFVLANVLGYGEEDGARALGISASAFKVRLSRARKKVGDYLAPRCEHVDPRNPCHCPSRIGVALRKGFIAPPSTSEVSLHKRLPFVEGQRQREAVGIYRTLPVPEAPEPLRRRLDDALATGRWDAPIDGG